MTNRVWAFGPFRLNAATSELFKDGEAVAIEPQSLRLLEYLIRHKDRVVSREDLVDAVWQGRVVSDWAISGAIKALRRTLDDLGPEKVYVRTVHSRGFRFVADVASTPLPDPLEAHPTVLVRVFRVLGEQAELGYLAEGLTEDLIAGLSGKKSWRILSYNTSRALGASTSSDIHDITTIVDGSIRKLGGTIRITVSVLDGAGAQQIWAETFDLTAESLLAGHDMIRDRLIAVLSPGDTPVDRRERGTTVPAAYDHYQRGRYAYYRYEPKAFVEALAHFRTATELDPGFGRAYAQQAYCRTTLYVFGLPGADTTLDAAEALARTAIEIDDASALGHARLGWVLGYLGRPDETIAAFDAALARDPDDAEVHLAYGETLNRLARPELATSCLETVFSKDSYFPPSWEFPQGHTQILLGDRDGAITHFRSVLDRLERFIPARVQLARALWERGDETGASDCVSCIMALAPTFSLAHAGRMFPYPVETERDRLLTALGAAGMQ